MAYFGLTGFEGLSSDRRKPEQPQKGATWESPGEHSQPFERGVRVVAKRRSRMELASPDSCSTQKWSAFPWPELPTWTFHFEFGMGF